MVSEGIRPVFDYILIGVFIGTISCIGLNMVLNPKVLTIFSIQELEDRLCGQPVEWTREMLLESIDFCGGFGKEDAYIQQFVDVLISLTLEERERLLMFVTGKKRFTVVHRNFAHA